MNTFKSTVVLATLLSPGDLLLTEALTYAGLKSVVGLLHLKVAGLPVDAHGLRPDAFEQACRKGNARALYEDLYCARGDMENRIKEQQLDLFADRTSTQTLYANQLRLYFSSFAYVLECALRRLSLRGTELEHAQCGTIRTRLLKVGAQVRVSVRKVWISFSEAFPLARLFVQALHNIQAVPVPIGSP